MTSVMRNMNVNMNTKTNTNTPKPNPMNIIPLRKITVWNVVPWGVVMRGSSIAMRLTEKVLWWIRIMYG